MKKIFYGKQKIFKEDIKNFEKTLLSKQITTGKSVTRFENKLKYFLNNHNIKVCNSGTSALHLAFLCENFKKGSNIIMPSINFIASYSIAKQLRLNIYLADVDPITGQMRPSDVERVIKKNQLKKIDAIVTMYMGGYPENIIKFYKLKKKFNCILIEDACHAFGAKYKFKNKIYSVGSCKHSDYCTFSFHPLKTITTGEGGAIITKSKKKFLKINKLLSHGIIRNKTNYWEYDIKDLSYNFRLSDINCELGIRQLKKLNFILKYRKFIYNFYSKKLKKFSEIIKLPSYSKNIYPSFHLFLANIDFKKLKVGKNFLIKYFKKKNIFLQQHYIPIYKFSCVKKKKLPDSEKYINSSLSLPIHLDCNQKDLKRVIYLFEIFFKKYKKNEKTT